MWYEVWDTDTATIVGEFDTEEAALALVRDMIAVNGRGSVRDWSLAAVDAERTVTQLARGATLARRAQLAPA